MNALLENLTVNTIYLMGGSFVLGSLLTILLLIIIDVMRLEREKGGKEG